LNRAGWTAGILVIEVMHSSGGGDVDELKKKTTYSDIHVSCHWISLIFVEVPTPQAHRPKKYLRHVFRCLESLEMRIPYPKFHQLSTSYPWPTLPPEGWSKITALSRNSVASTLRKSTAFFGQQTDGGPKTTAMCRMRRWTSTCTKMMQKTSDVA